MEGFLDRGHPALKKASRVRAQASGRRDPHPKHGHGLPQLGVLASSKNDPTPPPGSKQVEPLPGENNNGHIQVLYCV